jgi:regulator of sirC expression with transglutaminase-like and TPR domain
MPAPALRSTDALDYFTSLVADDASLPLVEAAAAVAQDALPDGSTCRRAGQDRCSGRPAAASASRPTRRRCSAFAWLNRYFFQELGFAGNVNNYYDPDNSYLHRRAAHAARHPDHAGAAVHRAGHAGRAALPRGVSFPGHFLVKLRMPQGEVVIDPVHRPFAVARGSRRTPAALPAPTRPARRVRVAAGPVPAGGARRATWWRACCAT